MPQRSEDLVKKEKEQNELSSFDFIFAPLPGLQDLTLDTNDEYSQKKAELVREKVTQAGDNEDQEKFPFHTSHAESEKAALLASIESGELPQRKLRRIYSLAKLRFLGVRQPTEFLEACFDQPTSMFIEYENKETYRDTMVGLDYSKVIRLSEDLAEVVSDPVLFLKRSNAIGFVFTMITRDQKSSPEMQSLIKKMMELPEDQFSAAASSLQQMTWLETAYGFEDYIVDEFTARMTYLEEYPNIMIEDQAALQGQVVLESLCGAPINRLSQVLGHNDEIQALVVIAQELAMHQKNSSESTSRFRDKEKLRKIWARESILFDLAERIEEGRRIDPTDKIYSYLDRSQYIDDEQVEDIESKIGVSLTQQQERIADLLDLHSLETTELVVQIDALIRKTLDTELPLSTREAIITILNKSQPENAYNGISDVFKPSESNEILKEWIDIDKKIQDASRIRRAGDEHNFMDVLDRRLAFRRLLTRTMLVGEDGAVDTELVRFLASQAKEVSLSACFDESTKDMLPEVEEKLIRLIDQIDPSATNLLDFLVENIDEIAQYVDADFKVNEKFLLFFFESNFSAASNSHNEIAQMLENSGIADGLVDYLNKIWPVLRLSGTPLSSHYKPIFLIFFNSKNEADLNQKMLDYWRENHPAVFIRSFSKELLADYFGEKEANAFLSALPKSTDERRNAFLHNDYDRTSQWLVEMQKQTTGERFGVPFLEEISFSFADDIEVATAFIEKFGLARNPFLLEVFKALKLKEANSEYELPQKVVDLGLESLDDLYKDYDQVQGYLISTEPLTDLQSLSEFQKVLLSSVTGKDTHTFSRSDSIQDIINRFEDDLAFGGVTPVEKEYVVEKISFSDVQINYEPSELVQQKFNLILQMVGEILEKPDNDHWKSVVDDFKKLLAAKVVALQQTLEQVPEKQAKFINSQLEQLAQEVQRVEQVGSIDEALQVIGVFNADKQQSDQWEVLVQRLVFSRILEDGPLQDKLQSLAAASELSPKALLTAINVYDELIKHHAINFSSEESSPYWSVETRSFFSDKKMKKQLKKLKQSFSGVVSALKADVDLFEKTVLDSQRGIDMIPDKGLIGEMSGYVANACYTAEQSLLRNWDVTPYKFIDTTKEPAELVGTGLIFEVELESGEKALLVRAINIPNEEAYDMETFCEEFIEAVARVGSQVGAKKILVPGSTGAMSNYQMTIAHIKSTYCEGKQPVTLSERFAFNGYDLTENSFVAREL